MQFSLGELHLLSSSENGLCIHEEYSKQIWFGSVCSSLVFLNQYFLNSVSLGRNPFYSVEAVEYCWIEGEKRLPPEAEVCYNTNI